jgi:hypothetical protein
MAGPFDYQQPSTNGSTVKRKLFSKSNSIPAALLSIDANPFVENQIFNGATLLKGSTGGATTYQAVLLASPSSSIYSQSAFRSLPSSANWSATSSTYNGVVVVASGSNKVAYGNNGTTYSAATLPSSSAWNACCGDGADFLALASGSTTAAISNDAGATWAATGALPASATWTGVAMYASYYAFAIASGGTQAARAVGTRTTWTSATLPTSANWIACCFNGATGIAIATSGAAAYSSNQGSTWTAATLPAGPSNWVALASDGTNTVAIASDSTTYATTTNGITWTSRTLNTTKTGWIGITVSGSTFTVFTATGDKLTGTFDALFPATNITATSPLALAYGNGIFMHPPNGPTTGNSSSDGITWTPTGAFPLTSYLSIAYGGGYWVAIDGSGNSAYSSNNGTSWTSGGDMTGGGTISSLVPVAITYGNGLFVVVGNISDGASMYVLTSPTGVTWTARSTPVSYNYRGRSISYSSTSYLFMMFNYNVASSSQVPALTSPDGITWTSSSTTYTYVSSTSNQYCLTAAKTGFIYQTPIGNSTYASNYINFTQYGTKALPFPLTANGSTSTNVIPQTSGTLYSVLTYSSELGMYLVLPTNVADGSNSLGFLSVDGTNWFSITMSYYNYKAIANGNGVFVAITSTGIAVASNLLAQSLVLTR